MASKVAIQYEDNETDVGLVYLFIYMETDCWL